MDDGLQLTLLGKLEVTRDGVPVTGFAHKKSLALLCYLAVTGRPHTREALAGLLWGEAAEANARAGLRKVLAELRQRVASHLVITRQRVAFNQACRWLDVEVFEHRVGEILGIGEREGALTDEDAAALTSTVELYQGDFLEGFHVRRAPAFEDWVLLERERLRLSALQALHRLAAHYATRGAYARAITYTGRVLALEPGQEEAHRQVMSLLALSGQRATALRQYRICRLVLAETLGVEPEEETTALYKRIRDGVELDVCAPAPRHNLPTPLISLIGREAELAEIVVRLQDPACRLLTLVGPGGSGKTHLAAEAAGLLTQAKRFANTFKDGVFWVSLALLRSADAIVRAIAHSLGFLFYRESDPRQQLLDYVCQKDLLLVMDNAEHLLPPSLPHARGGDEGGASLVTDILEAAPAVKILVTSRARLNLQYEHLFPIAGMDLPFPPSSKDGREAGACSEGNRRDEGQYDAVQLFVAGARRVRPDFEPTSDDLVDVARICRLVEGMPLGILLAASWARILSPAEIAAQLSGDACETGRSLDLLEINWHDVPARHRSMRAVFDHSWSLLTEREQGVLAALSVFRGSFTHEAARQISDAALRDLMALADQSLLHRASSGRYEIHELLRQYAEEKLEESSGAAETAHDRHCGYFCGRLQEWAGDLKGARQQAALAEMDVEIADARAAWDWAVARGQVARIDQAMEGLCLFYEWRTRHQGKESACRAAAQELKATSSVEGLRVRAKALAWQGQLRQSLCLLEQPELAGQDTRAERAFVLLRMGDGVSDADCEEARRLYEQSLTLYRALGDRWGTANALSALGAAAWDLAAYDEAKLLFEESLAIHQELGDQRGIAHSLELTELREVEKQALLWSSDQPYPRAPRRGSEGSPVIKLRKV